MDEYTNNDYSMMTDNNFRPYSPYPLRNADRKIGETDYRLGTNSSCFIPNKVDAYMNDMLCYYPPFPPYAQSLGDAERKLIEMNHIKNMQRLQFCNHHFDSNFGSNYAFPPRQETKSSKVILYDTLWKMSTHEYTIKYWIRNYPNCIVEIIKIADNNLKLAVMIDAFRNDTCEYFLAISTVGILANLLYIEEGLKFMMRILYIFEFYDLLVWSSLYLESSLAGDLKREILRCIYYAMFCPKVVDHLQHNENLYKILKICLKPTNPGDIIEKCLLITKNLLCHGAESKCSFYVIEKLPAAEIKNTALNGEDNLKRIAESVLKKVEKICRYYNRFGKDKAHHHEKGSKNKKSASVTGPRVVANKKGCYSAFERIYSVAFPETERRPKISGRRRPHTVPTHNETVAKILIDKSVSCASFNDDNVEEITIVDEIVKDEEEEMKTCEEVTMGEKDIRKGESVANVEEIETIKKSVDIQVNAKEAIDDYDQVKIENITKNSRCISTQADSTEDNVSVINNLVHLNGELIDEILSFRNEVKSIYDEVVVEKDDKESILVNNDSNETIKMCSKSSIVLQTQISAEVAMFKESPRSSYIIIEDLSENNKTTSEGPQFAKIYMTADTIIADDKNKNVVDNNIVMVDDVDAKIDLVNKIGLAEVNDNIGEIIKNTDNDIGVIYHNINVINDRRNCIVKHNNSINALDDNIDVDTTIKIGIVDVANNNIDKMDENIDIKNDINLGDENNDVIDYYSDNNDIVNKNDIVLNDKNHLVDDQINLVGDIIDLLDNQIDLIEEANANGEEIMISKSTTNICFSFSDAIPLLIDDISFTDLNKELLDDFDSVESICSESPPSEESLELTAQKANVQKQTQDDENVGNKINTITLRAILSDIIEIDDKSNSLIDKANVENNLNTSNLNYTTDDVTEIDEEFKPFVESDCTENEINTQTLNITLSDITEADEEISNNILLAADNKINLIRSNKMPKKLATKLYQSSSECNLHSKNQRDISVIRLTNLNRKLVETIMSLRNQLKASNQTVVELTQIDDASKSISTAACTNVTSSDSALNNTAAIASSEIFVEDDNKTIDIKESVSSKISLKRLTNSAHFLTPRTFNDQTVQTDYPNVTKIASVVNKIFSKIFKVINTPILDGFIIKNLDAIINNTLIHKTRKHLAPNRTLLNIIKLKSNIRKMKTRIQNHNLKLLRKKHLNILYFNSCLIHPYVLTQKDNLPMVINLQTHIKYTALNRRFYFAKPEKPRGKSTVNFLKQSPFESFEDRGDTCGIIENRRLKDKTSSSSSTSEPKPSWKPIDSKKLKKSSSLSEKNSPKLKPKKKMKKRNKIFMFNRYDR